MCYSQLQVARHDRRIRSTGIHSTSPNELLFFAEITWRPEVGDSRCAGVATVIFSSGTSPRLTSTPTELRVNAVVSASASSLSHPTPIQDLHILVTNDRASSS
jgi:hypothetical protein